MGSSVAFAQAADSYVAAIDTGWSQLEPETAGAGAGTVEQTFAVGASRGSSPDMAALRRAWHAGNDSLDQRVRRTRRAALERGIWNLDSAARALVDRGRGTSSIEHARAAIRLAPDLPLARMALARALWLQESSPIAAIRAIWGALLAIPRHLEASLWFGGTALYVMAWGLISGGILCITVAAVAASPHAAHDLGDAVSGDMPAFARAGLLAAVVGIPVATGQGWVGAGLGLFAVAALYGTSRQRWALATAAASIVVGMYPIAHLSGAALTAYSSDPVAEAAYSATEGLATPIDRRRLEQHEQSDPLAARALAVTARRAGNLASADARYQAMLADGDSDMAMLNNAANVRLALGHIELALDLYHLASEHGDSPKVLFNLAQAHGASFAVEDLNRTLAAAQRLDGNTVGELTQLQGSEQKGFTVDLPIGRKALWTRGRDSAAAGAFADELRARIAPGALGRGWQGAAGAFSGVLLVSVLSGRRLRPSHRCSRCGRRLCPRCDTEFGGGENCAGCTRLFHQPETTDRWLRLARINALRRRDVRLNRAVLAASILIPGSAGMFSRQPWSSLIGSLSVALAIGAIAFRNGAAVDPLVAGSAAPVAFGLFAVLCLGIHALTVAASLAARRRS